MSSQSAGRFLPIDALRGVAALAVMLHHMLHSAPQTPMLVEIVPAWFKMFSDYGRNGVAVFFVISGFVIAYSTRNLGTRPAEGLRFALRRQVRLDPPYYVVIAVVVLIGLVEGLVPGLQAPSLRPSDVLLNALYLHEFAGAQHVLAVAWTLCLEVQFYVFLVLTLLSAGWFVRNRGSAERPEDATRATVRRVALTAGAVSLALPFLGVAPGALFISYWWMFCLGMVVCWYMLGAFTLPSTLTVVAVVAAWSVAVSFRTTAVDPHAVWAAMLTGAVILALVQTSRMSARPPQVLLYLGALSYSLYLVHLPVIHVVMSIGYKVSPDSPAVAIASYLCTGALSIVAAAGLRHFVEMPAMRWAEQMKGARRPQILTGRRQPLSAPTATPLSIAS